jgi:hypothetical protein
MRPECDWCSTEKGDTKEIPSGRNTDLRGVIRDVTEIQGKWRWEMERGNGELAAI